MKFSVLLVSVNIAATLPLAVAGTALANDGATSDKVDWLKSSLASLDTSASQKKVRARKISYSLPTPDINGKVVLHSNGVRLRPFVPGRKLPSQHDLDVQFIAQTAKMAQAEESPNLSAMTPRMAPGPLTGQVSDSYANPSSASVDTYGSVGYVRQSTSRVAPGQVPAVPGQIRQFKNTAKRNTYVSQPVRSVDPAEVASQSQPFRMTMPPVIPASPMQQALQMPPPAMPLAPTTPEPGQQQVGLSPEEQSIIDRMEANNRADGGGMNGYGNGQESMPSMGSSAGPPPFPLNLLPQDSLKQIVSGMHHSHTSAPKSYFGSWRGNSMASLPTGSFQSYAAHSAPKHAAQPHAAAQSSTHAKPAVHTAMAPQKHAVESSHSIGQLRRLAPHEAQVASYANYARFGSASAIAY